MRALFFAPFLVVSLLVGWSAVVDAQEALTNQSIVEMVKAGLSERVIIAKIRSSPTNFDTQTDALIALKKNGVPEKVIEAIMSPSAPAAPAAAAPAPAGSVAMTPPAATPGPSRPTVYQIVAGKEVELVAASSEVQRNSFRYSRSTEVVIAGNKAKLRTAERQPVFVITAAPSDLPLVRLDPGKSDRNLKVGSSSRVPYAGGSTTTRGSTAGCGRGCTRTRGPGRSPRQCSTRSRRRTGWWSTRSASGRSSRWGTSGTPTC